MKKVVYSVTKANNYSDYKITGIGCITDEDLIIACISKNGKAYIRVFEDCIKNCYPVSGKTGEFKGMCQEIHEYEGRDIHTEYSIWYKIQE